MRTWTLPEADDSQRRDVRRRRNVPDRGRADLNQPAPTRPLFRFGRWLNVDDQGRAEHRHASGCDLLIATWRSRLLRRPLRLAHSAPPLSDELAAVIMEFVERIEEEKASLDAFLFGARVERDLQSCRAVVAQLD